MWKIYIYTLVIAVVAATTSETITNDLTAKSNRTLLKISTDESREISAVGGSTSTATPTTTATTSTTTTRATTVADEEMGETSTPTTVRLMTTTQKMVSADLGEIGSIKDALHRIKLSEKPVDGATTTTEQPEAMDQDEQDEEDVTPTISPLQIQMQAAASYQVAETLADLNEEERARYDAMLAQQPTASKLNIVDLYPLKIEDFQPIIQNDNDELIKQRTVFTQPENAEEYKQNLMPNEVEMLVDREVIEVRDKIQINQEKFGSATTVKPTTIRPQQGTTADFTGKLLADQDDLITEIESKFQLHETTTLRPKATTQQHPGNTFIDRRVKKSFEFPMQHRASDVMAMPHIDFANTKFQTDADAPNPPASHPEFSTTKFYNSKELYNEMLLHNKRKLMKAAKAEGSPIKSAEDTTRASSSNVTPEGKTFGPTATTTTTTTTTAGSTTTTTAESTSAAATTTRLPATTTGKYQKQLKRAKLLLKALTPPKSDDKSTASPAPSTTSTSTGTSSSSSPTSTTITSSTTTTMATLLASVRTRPAAANPTKTASKPIARPRILSRLQEKINSLECEISNVPQDSHLWRGNETHELLLPIVTTEHCQPDEHCVPNVLTWRGEAEIQSGDILIVEINDAMLNPSHEPNNTSSAVHATQVYQVTRSGHEHCDVTEGVLLDITPLVVDGRKLVTLYDKDLTEGVNLLIVVSELWGAQCVRLKVTTKTDNCGENADCSGKGVCYSNAGMEEYECQCCSGFAGPHCEEIDACNPSPCTNNGICVDLSQGHEGNSYQCLCPYGYAGKNCQYESDPCNPAECMNGGSCVGNSTHFRCDCAPGFTGPLCQHSLNECESSPCVHGICVDQEDGFRCFCQPGFAGELCNFEYNECESNPCQNGGECIDHIGSYECRCTKGFSGNRCQIKVDFCANKPCPEGHRCIDHGNDFSCECPGGRNGPDCNQMPRTQCNVNPCTHGGTCWSSGDSFYCACRPGYTGTMCEDEFVVETVVSSSEFIVDDANARNFNDKTFGSSVVLKSPIELHNAYFAAGVLAAAIFIVAVVVTICHCKVNQTYRKFSTRSTSFIPILGFSRRPKVQGKLNKHWLSGKGATATSSTNNVAPPGGPRAGGAAGPQQGTRHLPGQPQTQTTLGGQLQERPFQRHLAMNLENDMYYTVDFSENSQHSPLIQ
ncbi:protein HEG isoform X2 [Drosophila santomea]|uniref:protein HEG isoform X2 n=1 Tax=Drosophila santomea TaxID=129105 RepID=UPI001953F672|nr:protein HEG isoform X2 [Drosophila santomea]